MKRNDDDRIRFWHVCAGLALVAGMLRFGMVQSEPPTQADARVAVLVTAK